MTHSLDDISEAAGNYLESGDPARALALYRQAVEMATAAGRQRDLSDLLGDMAVAHRRLGDVDAAIETNRRAIEAARACDYHLNVARWSGNLGGLLYSQDDIDGAEACFRDAVGAAARAGSAEQMSIAAGHFAGVMGERGRFSEAVTIMADAREHARSAPSVVSLVHQQEADLYLRWAYSLRSEHRFREARDVIARALTGLGGSDNRATVMLLVLLGDIEENDGDIVAASAALERAAAVSQSIGNAAEAKELGDLARRMRG